MATNHQIRQKTTAAGDLIDLALEDLAGSAYTDALYNLHLAEDRIQSAMLDCIELARCRGETWVEIGLALGITAQGAFLRWSRRSIEVDGELDGAVAGQYAALDA